MRTRFIQHIIIVFVASYLICCTNKDFKDSPNTKNEANQEASESEKREERPRGSSTSTPQTKPERSNPSKATIDVNTASQTQGARQGSLGFPVSAIANMEAGYQATNAGFRVIISDLSDKTVAAGAMRPSAVMKSERLDIATKSGWPAVILNPDLQYIAPEISPGTHQGKIRVCMAQNPSAPMADSVCKKLTNQHTLLKGEEDGQLWRPFQWVEGKDITYHVSSDNHLKVVSYGHGLGLTGKNIPNLATHHPIFAPVVGDKTHTDLRSPIIIDLNQNKKWDLVSVWNDTKKVYFDLTGSGKRTRTGWVDSSDALLAIDLNNNGKVDDGGELFGQSSQIKGQKIHENGFAALSLYDDNKDSFIDKQDDVFRKLLIWQDKNSDGVSQPGELTPFSSKVSRLSLSYRRTLKKIRGNEVRILGDAYSLKGEKISIADIWFQRRQGLSVSRYLDHRSEK